MKLILGDDWDLQMAVTKVGEVCDQHANTTTISSTSLKSSHKQNDIGRQNPMALRIAVERNVVI